MVQLEDFTVLCTNCLVFNFVCQWQRSVQSYNSWRTKEVLTKMKKTSNKYRCMRRKPFRFPLRTQMVCLLFSRQLLGYLVNMYQWHAWPIPNALSIYHTVDCRTIAQIDNKFIKYYLLNDFSTPKYFRYARQYEKSDANFGT